MSDPRSNRTDLTGDRLRTIQPLAGAAVGVLDTDRTTLYGRTVLTGLQGTPSASAAAVPTREEGYACLTSPPKRCSSRRLDLQAGALRLPEVLMQSVTLVAPAIATLFSFGFIVGSFAGLMAPFAFAIVLLIALMLAINLSMLARLFPSAGGYFTYISRAIHPRVGMFAGWLYFLINPLVPGSDPGLHGDGARQRAPGQVRLQLPLVALRHPRHRRHHVRRATAASRSRASS